MQQNTSNLKINKYIQDQKKNPPFVTVISIFYIYKQLLFFWTDYN